MSRFLALEWNENEARVAVVGGSRSAATVEHAFTVSLRSNQSEAGATPEAAASRLAAALAARGLGRMESLVAVGRNSVELRQFTIPPAPEAELPDMVRFQALREFSAMDEDWLLDFLPIDEDPDQPRAVLVAAVSPSQAEQVRRVAQEAGLKPRRLVLRSCAAASLYARRQDDGRPRVRLLVDLFDADADLTVMVGRKVIFLRTARLSSDPFAGEEGARPLLAEFRRTMAAVQNQLGGRKVESLVLCGGEKHAALADLISRRLELPVEVFDPFAGFQIGEELSRAMPEYPGRFAPLLGMLLDELSHDPPSLDFFHPRRRPEPKSHRLRYGLIATAAVAVVGLWLGFMRMQCSSLDAEIEELKQQQVNGERQVKKLQAIGKDAEEVLKWQGVDASALQELEWLASSLPSSEDVMLNQLSYNLRRANAETRFSGLAKTSEAIKTMDRKLSVPPHQLTGQSNVAQAPEKSYGFQFNKTVLFSREQPK